MVGCRVRVIEQHEVDIRGVVQLPPPQLPHAEHDQPAALAGGPGVALVAGGQPQLAALRRGQQQVGAGEVDAGLRQVRERLRDPVQPPKAGDIGGGDDQRGLALHLAQQRRHLVAAGGGVGVTQRVHRQGLRLVRAAFHQPGQGGRLAQRQVRQVGAVAAQRVQQRGALGGGGEGAGGRVALGEALAQPLGGRGVEGGWQAFRQQRGVVHCIRGKA